MMAEENASFEMIRQSIDVGGPSMSHNARKAFISTALITDPENYKDLIDELEKNNGAISLATRLVLAKKASKMINQELIRRKAAVLLITHSGRILNFLTPDVVSLMLDGKIVYSCKNYKKVINTISKNGYKKFKEESLLAS